MTGFRAHFRTRVLVTAFVAAAGQGCATVPEPTAQLTSARTALAAALDAGANELAPFEAQKATATLRGAEAAVRVREFANALRLAEQAGVDARLAETKARSASAQRRLEQLQSEVRTLQRMGGGDAK